MQRNPLSVGCRFARLCAHLFPSRVTAFHVSLVLFVFLPAFLVVWQEGQGLLKAFAVTYAHFLIFLVPIGVLVSFRVRHRFIVGALSLGMAVYGLLVYFLIGYMLVTGGPFDMYFVFDSLAEVPVTVRDIVGVRGIVAAGVGFVFLGYALFSVQFRTLIRLRPLRLCVSRGIGVLFMTLVAGSVWAVPPAHGLLSAQIAQVVAAVETRTVVVPEFIDTGIFSTDSSESVFILQLESLNAMAMEGRAVVDGRVYGDVHNIRFRDVAKDGIYFPLFWGNAVQTNRGQETILCGVTNNMGDAFSYHPDDITGPCLPRILADAGYDTVFLSAYYEGEYMNLDRFVRTIGFTDVHHGDMMVEGVDKKYPWGYDDCDFYDRAFDYLSDAYPDPTKKTFVYFEASANHIPFSPKEEYDEAHVFGSPSNFIEKYINAAREQDVCLARFYDRFVEYTGGKAHLLIVPDHSWPVGIHSNTYNQRNAFNDNFLVSVAYVPPVSRRDEFSVGFVVEKLFAQTDILPTLFEVLNGAQYQNSFAWALRGESQPPSYEDCHVLAQPYGGGMIGVVRGNDKYLYSVSDQVLTRYDLSTDLPERHPTVVSNNLSYDVFKDRYFCERFGKTQGTRTRVFTGPVHLGDETVRADWISDGELWEDVVGDGPRDMVEFSFAVDPGTTVSHIGISAADMEGVHDIILNGERIATTCSTGVEKLWTCIVTLDHPVTLQSKNTMVIRLGEEGWHDDFILDSISIISPAM